MTDEHSSRDRPTLRERLRYRFDNLLAKGTWAVLAWLGLITLGVVVLASLSLRRVGVTLSGSTNSGWFEDFWQSLLRTLDTGTMAGDSGVRQRLVALIVTLFGVLVAGTVIGVIASGVEGQIDRMKRGRSTVIESDHLVVLGESSMLPVVVEQLALANRSAPTAIVVLADRDSTEMRDEVRRVVHDTHRCRLVFRTGDPVRTDDLQLVRLHEARSVIVLNGDGAHAGDARAAHTVLAVRDLLGAAPEIPIVVMFDDARVARGVAEAGGPSVHPLVTAQAVGRTAAFSLRERGLGDVMDQLNDFQGSDIHIVDVEGAGGLTFGEIVARCANARPIGLLARDGAVRLDPDPAVRCGPGDRLVAVAANAHAPTLRPAGSHPANPAVGAIDPCTERGVEHLVVLGWNSIGPHLLDGWALTAARGSTVRVVVDGELVDAAEVELDDLDLASVDLVVSSLGALAIDDTAIEGATTIVVLSYRDHLPFAECDSRTLLDLMALRRRLDANGGRSVDVIVELLDADDDPLARAWGATEVMVTPTMASRLIAQLADQPERRAVYLALYANGGPSIHLVPAQDLGLAGDVTMDEVARASVERGVLAVGWRRSGVTTLNPVEGEQIRLDPGDQIVVVG